MEIINDDLKEFCRDRYTGSMPFEEAFNMYVLLPEFEISSNIFEHTKNYNEDVQQVVRLATQYFATLMFKAMKVDMTDPNVAEDLSVGNISTPGRIAKIFLATDNEDMSEPLSGRWTKKPRMASFPNNGKDDPVFVKTRLDATCSHHLIRFGDDPKDEDSFVVIGYLPRKKLGGISKINRFVDWCARRGWLQESLAEYIGKEIMETFETDSVYVALVNLKHGCASTRGACDREAATTTIYSTGEFKKNTDLVPQKFRG